MSSSLKQEALRARKGKCKQISIKHIRKGEILTNLDYIQKVDKHKIKTFYTMTLICYDMATIFSPLKWVSKVYIKYIIIMCYFFIDLFCFDILHNKA